MKTSIFINKKDFDSFFRWVKRLEIGVLSTPPVLFSHIKNDIEDPLQIFLDTNLYYLIIDAQDDLENIKESFGSLEIQYELDNQQIHLQTIKDSMRRAKRKDLELELIYSALAVMKDIPRITPSEAIIIAEQSLLKYS